MNKTLNQRIYETPADVKKAIYDSGYEDGLKRGKRYASQQILDELKETVKTKFITFEPEWDYSEYGRSSTYRTPAVQINDWLKENPGIEIIHWQACPVGDHNELYITIQYKEQED